MSLSWTEFLYQGYNCREAALQLPAGTICLFGDDDRTIAVKRAIEKIRKDISIVGFLDTHTEGECEGLPVFTPEGLKHSGLKYDYIFISSNDWEQIEWMLTDMGVDAYLSMIDYPPRLRKRFHSWHVRYLIWKSLYTDFKNRKQREELKPQKNGRVYDCFSFFNELELLEIRLHELDSAVDFFVLVEANKTHTGLDKPFYFDENKDRFSDFHDKIIHIKVDDFPRYNGKNSWRLEKFQRNALLRGLAHAQPDDVIIVSDLDEIPSPKAILKYKNTKGIKQFGQRWYRFFLNYLNASYPEWRYGSRMGTLSELEACRKPSLFPERPSMPVNEFYRYAPRVFIPNGGWHFSFLGGIDSIMEKIDSLARPDNGLPKIKKREVIKKMISEGKDISGNGYKLRREDIDNSYPEYVRTNLKKFSHLIAE